MARHGKNFACSNCHIATRIELTLGPSPAAVRKADFAKTRSGSILFVFRVAFKCTGFLDVRAAGYTRTVAANVRR